MKPRQSLDSTLMPALVAHAVDAIISVDVYSRVTLWNPAAERMFGYTAQETSGQDIAELIIPLDYREGHRQGMERVRAGQSGRLMNRTTEISALRKNGEIFPIELSLFQTGKQDKPQFTAIVRDVSLRKNLEAELEERNKALDRLLKMRTRQLAKVEYRAKLAREIADSIRQEIELDKVLRLTLERVGEFTQADRCVIWLFDSDKQKFKETPYEYLSGGFQQSVSKTSVAHLPVLPYALNHRHVLALSDVFQADSSSVPLLMPEDIAILRERGIKSLLHVPILYQSELLGILRSHCIRQPCVWDDETVSLVTAIADQVGVAIHHAKILDEAKRNEQRFRAIFNNALYFIQILDTPGHFVDVNPAFCQLVGLPKDYIIGKTPNDIFEFETEPFEAIWAQLLQQGALRDDIPVTIRHNRQRVFLSYSALSDFLPGLHLVVAHDITQQKANEAELQKNTETLKHYSEQLLKSNNELEQFAAVASHDLQSPLRKVLMFIDALRKSESSQLSEIGLDYLDRIQKATNRMQALITDLLALSRITHTTQAFQSTHLGGIIHTVLDDFESDLKRKQAVVEVEPLPTIHADPSQMRQLFQNLIENALKFQQTGRVPQIRIYVAHQTDTEVCIGVQDNGIGFKQEYASRIFMVFERLHSAATFPGTGIGLAICQKIVERHGGTIEVKSAEGAGTIFFITLPIHQASVSLPYTDHPAEQ
jgi:PAS domain S-box-containing protein